MTEVIDLTGKRFGRLTVIRRCENKNGGRFLAWTCKCDCGKTVDVLGCNLRTGNTQSCGCYNIELCRTRSIIHGLSNHPLQKVYTGIMTRCYNPNCRSYKNYGAKGIYVCDEWRSSYPAFVEWCIEKGYEHDLLPNGRNRLSIDRIDPNGPYSPENCRFVTSLEQANNKTTTRYITLNSETHSLAEWSRITGIKRSTISYRLTHGWSVEKALTTEVKR